MATIASVSSMSPEACAAMILDQSDVRPSFAIVDVRDIDYIGGHIKGSIHKPINKLDALLPSLVREYKDKEVVVFHCSLSQRRGPNAAERYLRERDAILKAQGQEVPAASQRVVVLDGGFSGWQQLYGSDERLTDEFLPDFWP